ncbi:hypothetical protein [Kitasatospora sp. GP82]|uniref:hypothetical protein n=1 Tax=Kitasatospora sp. GP82 TaxID=3035089 RepID=UPI0024741E15|nr:hypothetical protein [Kitasatospora sp. GP82]MDH6127191.1 single-stranded DNA-specific DHH superfamily exonuclease [Kitasatospora sp. GP82]
MGAEREIADEELMEVGYDAEQAHRLHKALRTIADNPSVGEGLQRMAKDVLSGRVGMTDVVKSDGYLGLIGDRLAEMRKAAEELTPEERAESEKRAQKLREEQEEREAEEESREREAREAAERGWR